MNALENRQLEMLACVRDFGVARASDFAAGTLGQELFTSLTSQRNEAISGRRDDKIILPLHEIFSGTLSLIFV